MFTRLLVALDRSRFAECCIGVAVAIARASDADLDVVCVTEPQAMPGLRLTSNTVAPILAEEYVRTIADRVVSSGIERVHHTVLEGHPATEMCRHACVTGADLLVVASHGRTGFNRAWSHSLADELVRNSGIPVLVLRDASGKTCEPASKRLAHRILVTLDGSELSESVLPAAIAMADSLGAEVHLLRVVQPTRNFMGTWRDPVDSADSEDLGVGPAGLSDVDETAKDIKEASHSLAETMQKVEKYHASVFMHIVRDADVAGAIVDFSLAHDMDIIALASRGRGLSRLIVGSVADRILRSCELPILTLHAKTVDITLPLAADEVAQQLPAYSGI